MSDLSDRLSGLSPDALALLQRKLQKQGASAQGDGAPGVIAQRGSDGPVPLTFAQRGFWFREMLNPGEAGNHIMAPLHFRGDAGRDRIQRCVDALVARHTVLRSAIRVRDEEPMLIDPPSATVTVQVRDLRDAPDPDAALGDVLADERTRAFDLDTGPLMRVQLLRLGVDEYVLLPTFHHVICDHWSLQIFMRDFAALYAASHAGSDPALPALPIQFADYAAWEHDHLKGDGLDDLLRFWLDHVDGARLRLPLPFDRPAPDAPTYRAASHVTRIDAALVDAARRCARDADTTLVTTLLGVFQVLLRTLTGEERLVVAYPVANRGQAGTQDLIGCFYNDLLLCTDVDGERTFEAHLRHLQATIMDAQDHASVPIQRVMQELPRTRGRNADQFMSVSFNFMGAPRDAIELPGLAVQPVTRTDDERRTVERITVDLHAYFLEEDDGLRFGLDYSADRFEPDTVAAIAEAYTALLRRLVDAPATSVGDVDAGAALAAKVDAAQARRQPVALAGTYTVDPVEASLAFWGRQFGLDVECTAAPYGQLFQQLLDPTSLLRTRRDGVNALMVRWADWIPDASNRTAQDELDRTVSAFVDAVRAARFHVPTFVVVSPSPPDAATPLPDGTDALDAAESHLTRALADVPGVHVVGSNAVGRYPVDAWFDAYADAEAHVPYTPEGFTALGTATMRAVLTGVRTPSKVVVLDCDNTLWGGVCGEDGAEGIVVDAARREMHRFLVRLQQRGFLLALCSKNNESDVWDVFDAHPDVILRREHFAAWRINWDAKSDNLRALADELNLGLDSFVFLDDNPVECGEVRARCPEVLTLQVPTASDEVVAFLDHVWAFDRLETSGTDRRRTELYRQGRARAEAKTHAPSFADFLAGLDLRVDVRPMRDDDVTRAAQLTRRTNQFNATTRRRSVDDIRAFDGRPHTACFVTAVTDRFGDYGTVGVVLVDRPIHDGQSDASAPVEIETLLLSCRALGRGVEHQMLAHVGRWAVEQGHTEVVAVVRRTPKNAPVRDFLADAANALGATATVDGTERRYTFDADRLSAYTFTPPERSDASSTVASNPASDSTSVQDDATSDVRMPAESPAAPSTLMQRIAGVWRRVDAVHDALTATPATPRARPSEPVAPRTPTEEMMADVWTAVLDVDRVGVHDNFFDVGGHSLLGTVLVSRIRTRFGVDVSLLDLFDHPTVAELTAVVETVLIAGLGDDLDAQVEAVGGMSDDEVEAELTHPRASDTP